jgi:ABC-type transport system involved in cytochrome c biogenesis permease subunit
MTDREVAIVVFVLGIIQGGVFASILWGVISYMREDNQ